MIQEEQRLTISGVRGAIFKAHYKEGRLFGEGNEFYRDVEAVNATVNLCNLIKTITGYNFMGEYKDVEAMNALII